jgi:hypothetical protein
MHRLQFALILSLCATAAMAEDDDCHVPMADWQPRDAVLQLAAESGWNIYRIKTNDGCYQIKARDAQGHPIEVTLDPGTLAIIRMEDEALGLNDDGPLGPAPTDADGDGQ